MLDNPRPGLPGEEIIRRIQKALDIDGTHDWEDVRLAIIDGRAQVFWNDHGAWITELMVFPKKRLLNVWLVAGELPEVMDLQKEVEKYAITQTCDGMVVRGARLGWKYIAAEYGWTEQAMVLVKNVTEEMNRG